MKKIALLLLLTGVTLSGAWAQRDGSVVVDSAGVTRSGREVTVNLQLEAVKKIKRSYKLTLQPVLYKGAKEALLPPIVLRTRRGRILDFRHKVEYPLNVVVAPMGDLVTYSYTMPYAKWMNRSSLRLDIQSNGCCKEILWQPLGLVQRVKLAPDSVYTIRPVYAYIVPQAEMNKNRSESGSAFLEFPVGSAKLSGDFKNNARELAKINQGIEVVRDDSANKTLTAIELWGTCSPEGSWQSNARLAQSRAQAVQNYLMHNYAYNKNRFRTTSTPEDWEGLKLALQTASFAGKEEVLAIIDSDLTPDLKDRRIAALDKGTPYRYMLQNIYPQLRRVDYKVLYTVKSFTLDQAREVVTSRPQDLSLNELFAVANSYGEGSEQFGQISRTAALLYPNDPTANTNAATAALQQGNTIDAAQYLQRVTEPSAQYYNTLGILAMLHGDYSQAGSYLTKAADLGLPEATANLQQLSAKLKNIEQLAE